MSDNGEHFQGILSEGQEVIYFSRSHSVSIWAESGQRGWTIKRGFYLNLGKQVPYLFLGKNRKSAHETLMGYNATFGDGDNANDKSSNT